MNRRRAQRRGRDRRRGWSRPAPAPDLSAARLPPATSHRRGVPDDCPLSRAELEIVRGIADGLGYKEIARRQGLSPSTVRTHLTNAYARLGVGDRAQAVLFCERHGWLAEAIPEEDQVTPAQALYNQAFVRWLRTHDDEDREEMTVLLRIIAREATDGRF